MGQTCALPHHKVPKPPKFAEQICANFWEFCGGKLTNLQNSHRWNFPLVSWYEIYIFLFVLYKISLSCGMKSFPHYLLFWFKHLLMCFMFSCCEIYISPEFFFTKSIFLVGYLISVLNVIFPFHKMYLFWHSQTFWKMFSLL